jgi:RHS repeat-associated protein
MKNFLNILSLLFVTFSFAQTNLTASENYIYSKTCLNNDCTKTSENVQYFDSWGRPVQGVAIKASPLGNDVVSHIEYDNYGRQVKDYLPVPQTGTQNGAFYPSPLANASSLYGNEKIYSEKLVENSPLQRIQQQTPLGNAWSNKPILFSYDANKDGEVTKYTVTTTWIEGRTNSILSNNGNYAVNTLAKNMVTDEDGNVTIEFTNKQGQMILARKMLSATEKADTYYVYNEFNQLAYTLPPLASVSGAVSASTLDNLCYQYRYDGWNRLVEKKLPGKGWEYLVYNKADQLILAQDAALKGKGQWLFTKYDQFGRIAYTGITNNTASRVTIQNSANINTVLYETRVATAGLTLNGMAVYYTKLATPSNVSQVLSVNYYDTYPAGTPAAPTQVMGQDILSQDAQNSVISTKTLPTATYVRNIEDNGWTKDYIWYDTKGRAVGLHTVNHLGGYTRTESEIDFAGLIKQTKAYHKRLTGDPEKTITQSYEYDSQGRLLVHKHQIDNNTVEILSQNTYNELSQLLNKKVGGTQISQPLQTIDYKYNIRGWMTQINDPANLENDLFGYKMNYNQVEGLETPNPDYPNLKVKPRFNGNIAEVSWKTLTEENEPLKRYSYSYDALNRLSAGFYQKAGKETAKEYFESIEYDLNGNITRLKRSGELAIGNTTALAIDNLKYDYTGNKLIKVTDEQQNPSGYPYMANPGTIGYDNDSSEGNGNMISNPDKGISAIQYNYLNLPQQITQNAKVTQYTYRANGVKVKKLFGDIETDYLDGFQYKSTKPSESSVGGIGSIDDPNDVAQIKLRIIPTSEGYYDALLNQYVYNFTDHLGNVRLSYTDTNKDGIIQPRQYFSQTCDGPFIPPFQIPNCISTSMPGEIVEVNNYYPFGMMHNYTMTTQNAYQYKYNGKELQESGMYDYGARMYMPDLGRWGAIDPLAETSRRWSTYAFAYDSPVMFIDPDGMQNVSALNWKFDRNSTILGNSWFDDSYVSSGFGGNFKTMWNGGDHGGGSKALFNRMISLGGHWVNTGSGFTETSGISLGYDGSYQSLNINYTEGGIGDAVINIPEIIVSGKSGGGFGEGSYNSFMMELGMNNARLDWNLGRSRSLLYDSIENTKVGQSVSAAENFLFLELPASMVGGELLSAGWRAAGISKLICRPVGSLTNGLIKICFTEGTLVAIEKGSKKIEDIKEGDLVWSYNEETGKKELKKVAALSRNISSSLVKISVNGTEITCTPEHPFYVNENWVEAKDLVKGMLLTTLDGKTSLVESIKFLDEKVKVYNFEVEGNHNYYVSEKGILVHNNCEYTTEFIKGFYIRGMTSIENGVYTRTVQGLANYEGKSLFSLVRAFEAQAQKAGVNKVVIRGVDIEESRLMNETGARILGYTYKELSKNSIELVKFLK